MMVYKKQIPLYIAMLFICFSGCSDSGREHADVADFSEWPHAVTYEVFVHAFADDSGDGIGDFKGLTSRLDYIRDLGVKALWLMPIHPSPSYHKYDVTDYRAIHPDYGTMDDFRHFLSEAHARDIRVVIDFVVNHSSSDHPWFQEALADTASPFFDFYIWADEEEIESFTVDETGPDTDNIYRWHLAEELDLYYYGFFWGGMPDLNYDTPALRDSIYDIGRYWLEDIGVDGFRLDAARHIYPEDREEDIRAFWEEFRAEMEEINPDVYLVGEVWAEAEVVKQYLNGLPALFNFDLGFAIMEALQTADGSGLAATHAEIREAYRAVTSDFIDATFLTNHDQNRVMSDLDDENKARMAASLLLTLPGSPYIYYGEEIGMRGMKPDPNIREPMLWDKEPDPIRSTWIEPEYSTDSTVTPVSVQMGDESSLLWHYKRLIELRNSQQALTFGELDPAESPVESIVIFRRVFEDQSLLVIHNIGGESVQITLDSDLQMYNEITWKSGDDIEVNGAELTLPAYHTILLHRSAAP